MDITTVGVDIAKNVIQLHYIDAETGEIVNKPVKRTAFLEYFANRSACLIGMEACGGFPRSPNLTPTLHTKERRWRTTYADKECG